MDLFKTVTAYSCLFIFFSQILKFTKYRIKLIEKLSRRHLINSFDVFVIKGFTVLLSWTYLPIVRMYYNSLNSIGSPLSDLCARCSKFNLNIILISTIYFVTIFSRLMTTFMLSIHLMFLGTPCSEGGSPEFLK